MKQNKLSIEEAFNQLKTGKKITRESFLDGFYYYLDEEETLRLFCYPEDSSKVGLLAFLNPVKVDDWISFDNYEEDLG